MKHMFTFFSTLGLVLSSVSMANAQSLHVAGLEVPNQNDLFKACFVESMPAEKAQAAAEEEKVEIFADFDFSAKDYELENLYLINADHRHQFAFSVKNYDQLMVYPGTYDVFAEFEEKNYMDADGTTGPIFRWVIREQVEVSEGTYFSFTPTEATTHIKFECVYPNGEVTKQSHYAVDQNKKLTLIEEGNISEMWYINHIVIKENDENIEFGSNISPIYDYESRDYPLTYARMGDYYVNEVSNRFSFTSNRLFVNKTDRIWYTAYMETCWKDQEEIVVRNNPDNYVMHQEKYQQSPYGNASLEDANPLSRFSLRGLTLSGQPSGGWSVYLNKNLDDDEVISVYQSCPHVDNLSFFPAYQVGFVDGAKWDENYERWDYDYHDVFGTFTLAVEGYPLSFGPIIWQYRTYPKNDWYAYKPLFPVNPVYSTYVNTDDQALGSSCPIIVPRQNGSGNERYLYFNTIMGRRGEQRDCDVYTLQSQAYVDGTLVSDATMATSMGWTLDAYKGHDYKVVITDDNVVVDGMQGRSTNTLTYNTNSEEDYSAPVLTILDFINNDYIVTDRFATGADGTLRFYAADYKDTGSGRSSEFTAAPFESVTVSYAPYQSDEWKSIEVSENPYSFCELNAGYFYSTSLASVEGLAPKGWFDLKVELTDAAGNKSEQVISPAFRIDALAVDPDNISSISENNVQMINCVSADGKRSSQLQKGFNIVKMNDGSVNKLFVK